jgi:hypothetical protein
MVGSQVFNTGADFKVTNNGNSLTETKLRLQHNKQAAQYILSFSDCLYFKPPALKIMRESATPQ